MKKLEDNFVPYDLSEKLRDLGFDEPCFACLNDICSDLNELDIEWGIRNSDFENNETKYITFPLWQQAFDWFRKVYRLDSHISSGVRGFTYRYNNYYDRTDGNFDVTPFTGEILDFSTYEEARLACLKKLIEIVENDKRTTNS